MNDLLHQINDQYAQALSAVQTTMQSLIAAQPNNEARRHMDYVASTPGHMLRPFVALITFGAIDGRSFEALDPETKQKLIHIAAALELLHTASLVHDDVIDQTSQRRGKPTLSAALGNTEAVLIGNLFYLNAFRLMLVLEDPWYLEVLIQTAEAMCVGEVLQNEKQNQALSQAAYLEIISLKTGALIGAAAKLSARLARASEKDAQHYEQLALTLGTLYQLRDDYADMDLPNFSQEALLALIQDRQQQLDAALETLSTAQPHQKALISFIHYFKG